jgi:RHS repeat-associated protein
VLEGAERNTRVQIAKPNLDYYCARYYSPQLGRFISEDPIGFAGGINYYAYALNSPTNFTDPFGTSGDTWTQSAGDAAGMFFNWARGKGPNERNFGPNSVQVQDMRNAPGVQKARQFFDCKNSHSGPLQDVNNYDAGFGLRGAWRAGPNPTQQFIGN